MMPAKKMVSISTHGISSQLSTVKNVPYAFVVMEIVTIDDASAPNNFDLENVMNDLEETFGISFLACRLIFVPDDYNKTCLNDPQVCMIYLHESKWKKLGYSIISRSFVVIQPDGHVAAISDKNHLNQLVDDTQAIFKATINLES
jgi:hypothetical protein